MANVSLPEGWKLKQTKEGTIEDSKASSPCSSVGTPRLNDNEIIIEDGFANSHQYFISQDDKEEYCAIVPGLKDGKEYRGPRRKTRQQALEDGFKVLNSTIPSEFLARAAKRFPDSALER